MDRDFYFVLTSHDVGGFVHRSDLNNHMVKLPLYVLLTAVERHLALLLLERFPDPPSKDDPVARVCIKGNERKHVKKKFGENAKRDVNRRWFDVLHISTMLDLCRHTGLVASDEGSCKTLNKIRNRVMHEVKLVIEAPEDITLVMNARMLCEQMLLSVP